MTTDRGGLLRLVRRGRPSSWGDDPDQYDPEAVRSTVERARLLFSTWFRVEVRGFENVPDAPVMVVSNHSGGTTIPDVWGFLIAWYRVFGVRRPIHPIAHELILGTETTARFFARRGVLRASAEVTRRALEIARHDVMVMPGGDLDTWRPFTRRYEVRFGGRTGFARLALRTGTPIVPVANAGAHATLLVLTDGRRLARAMRLHAIARADVFPIHLSLPWGLAVGPWPHLPIPAKLRYRVGRPIDPPLGVGVKCEPTDAEVRAHAARVERAVQALLDDLRRR
jgi:1-acyl-sn-glycerol-3-phosphate acyltransferase